MNGLIVMNSGASETCDYLSFRLEGQLFGIDVMSVRDVLKDQQMTPIPLSTKAIEGALNLRGRIVTAINLRTCLSLPPHSDSKAINIVLEHHEEYYSFVVDCVEDVMNLPVQECEHNINILDPKWQGIACGIYRLEEELLVVVDAHRLIDSLIKQAA